MMTHVQMAYCQIINLYRVDRDDGRRGGGFALIYKKSLKIKTK